MTHQELIDKKQDLINRLYQEKDEYAFVVGSISMQLQLLILDVDKLGKSNITQYYKDRFNIIKEQFPHIITQEQPSCQIQ
jgi:hypothetical protein